MAGGIAGFGSGGLPNELPGRGYPEYGSDSFRDVPDDWVGGARGPAALPSRTAPITDAADRPAPSQRLVGASGTISFHRGAMVEDAGAPRLSFDNVLGHGAIPWDRPVYANVAGRAGYHPPTQQPSWTANEAIEAGAPVSPIPVQRKQIGNFTVREQFGSTREWFNTGSLAPFVARIPQGMRQQGRRWAMQSKTHNPTLVNRSTYGTAGSYGQTTRTLPTGPVNQPTTSEYGSY